VVVGMLTKRVPGFAGAVGLVVGLLLMLVGNFVPLGTTDAGKAYLLAGGWIHGFHYAGLVFALIVALMLSIGLVAPRKEAWVHEHSKDVDITPWKYAMPAGIALVIAVIAIYAVFADFTVL
jgi:SSS family solute:Na+ symporter